MWGSECNRDRNAVAPTVHEQRGLVGFRSAGRSIHLINHRRDGRLQRRQLFGHEGPDDLIAADEIDRLAKQVLEDCLQTGLIAKRATVLAYASPAFSLAGSERLCGRQSVRASRRPIPVSNRSVSGARACSSGGALRSPQACAGRP